ncbi:flagellar hook-basal body complex protein FliE [Campylobacter gastrosuis]|uniref:Flagellar hook-basal body complex protein FliE n=1 Tax=Campylobacter gastrosuis TaxID=2974576 RepID=A0ABT7HLT7_9BACT|nr:flagellar hook-basal body complex protein FliE [Campylobacter gastrosuis]MDL0087931.1 flagellar hook-basal body complex protein FliE [Campylobacter gastrosuis]
MQNFKIGEFQALNRVNKKTEVKNDGTDFGEILDNSLKELNKVQESADKAIADLATGEVKDLHQAAIAIGKAETSMKLMLEIRNKALSAYKEISRTQI